MPVGRKVKMYEFCKEILKHILPTPGLKPSINWLPAICPRPFSHSHFLGCTAILAAAQPLNIVFVVVVRLERVKSFLSSQYFYATSLDHKDFKF